MDEFDSLDEGNKKNNLAKSIEGSNQIKFYHP
jgi:hypothetical protein